MLEIKGFLEISFLDWPGKLCSVIFLPYCNFRCHYCHNHPLLFNPERFPSIPLETILNRLNSYRDWIDGVCITGGEPTIHKDLPWLIKEIKQNGYSVKLDTNGSNPQMLEKLIASEEIDFISMDIKAPLDPISYYRTIGVQFDLKLILRSIQIIKRGKIDFQFRMTVVPGLHNKEDIKTLGHQLNVGNRFILQSFNPENPLNPSFKSILPYDQKMLKEIERIAQEMI
jgi:pyruvate formate lyase activating enzyme